jgi:hypothetical protein
MHTLKKKKPEIPQINNLTIQLKADGIMKIRAEINKIEAKRMYKKSIKQRIDSLKR